MMAFDIQLEKNQQSYSAETNEKLSSDFQEEITSMDLITPPIQIIDSISQCKNFPKRHLFPSSSIESDLMTFTYLTKPKFDVVAIKKLDVNESSLSPNTKPEEKVPNPFNAGIRRVINPKCHGTATGSVKAKASGGMKPYHFYGQTETRAVNF
ncbi:MAG: hypothetical protein IPK10_12930 [Bacteroidetes bacterium]|nr:hypothetical protein [Bacteroidota bacterium]